SSPRPVTVCSRCSLPRSSSSRTRIESGREGDGVEDLTAGAAPPASGIDPDRIELYRSMARLRAFEKRAYDLFLQNLVKGTSHLGLGQEAIAAADGVPMRADDYTFCTYRGHDHTLARGVPMAPVMAELLGREGGLMGGKGGSMHLTSVAHGVMGSYAVVGGTLPIAAGGAWAERVRSVGT